MKLLFISPYTPTRIRTRPHHFLRALAKRGLDITLASLYDSEEERVDLQTLESEGIRILSTGTSKATVLGQVARAVLSGEPMQARYSWDPALAARLRADHTAAPFDVVHIEHLRGTSYGLDLKSQARPVLPVVWDSVDSISHLFAQAARSSASRFGRLVSRAELGRTRRFEGRMVQTFDRVLVTSEQDRQALKSLAGSDAEHKIHVIPNGVDLHAFRPIDEAPQSDTIVFTGKMSYHANVTAIVRFVREVMPKIWERRPGVRLNVVGKDPDRQVRQLAADPRIRIIGAVPDMRPHLGRAAVSVAPIAYGAGIQNKILEAMACRTPVVASCLAVSALETREGQDILVAADSDAFAAQVLRLLEDDALRESIAAAGLRYVQARHRWEDAAARLEDIYVEAIQSVR